MVENPFDHNIFAEIAAKLNPSNAAKLGIAVESTRQGRDYLVQVSRNALAKRIEKLFVEPLRIFLLELTRKVRN